MKRVVVIALTLLIMLPMNIKAVATNAAVQSYVRIYYFCDDSKVCDEGKEWLESQEKEDNRLAVNYVNDDSLYKKVKDKLGIKKEKLPLVIIGSNYFVGFNKNKLENAIEAYKKVDDYCDAVSKIRNDGDVSDCIKDNKGIYNDNFDTIIIIIGAIAIVAILVGAYIFIKRKNTKA